METSGGTATGIQATTVTKAIGKVAVTIATDRIA